MKNQLSILLLLLSFFGFANYFPNSQKLILTKMNGNAVEGTSVYITIDEGNTVISGKSGCNNLNINFTQKSKSCIKTGSGMVTMMVCSEAEMKLERAFLETIQNRKFRVKTKGDKVMFKNWWGKTLLEFEIQTTETAWNYIAKNNWKLLMLHNIGQDYGDAAIKFDLKEHRVTGNTGCNSFFGNFNVEGEYITFNQMGATKKYCDTETNKTESKVLSILSDKKLRYDVADQTLNLYDGDRMIMVFGIVK